MNFPEIIEQKQLPSGEQLRILRLVLPAEHAVPERIKRYFTASLGYDSYRRAVSEINYWRLYYRQVLDNQGSADHIYLAEVDGQLAARVWFAWSRRSGHGNFGNVYTEPEFRRKGLMKELMKPLLRDFHDSNATDLTCSTGNRIAAKVYVEDGFQLIYGGETGPLCLLNRNCGSSFFELQEKAFNGSEVQQIRTGNLEDQYDCDKFLTYNPEMWHKHDFLPCGPASLMVDYRTAFQEVMNGSGVIAVAENGTGTIAGYAFALKLNRQNILHMKFHPDNLADMPELLKFTIKEFQKKFGSEEPLFLWVHEGQSLLKQAAAYAGLKCLAELPAGVGANALQVYATV